MAHGSSVGLRMDVSYPQDEDLLGRDEDVAEILRRLDETGGLICLSGPGGVGKTRVARAVLEQWNPGRPGWFVCLEDVRQPDGLEDAVLRAVGARSVPLASPADLVARRVGPEPALLVLDSCEHLHDQAGALCASLRGGAPALRILVTSRRRLGRAKEDVTLGPLRVPVAGEPLAGALRRPAVALFLRRAGHARPGLMLDEESAVAAVRICRELDGLPLALELAAAHVRLVDLPELADLLTERLAVLRAPGPHGPARHRDMRACLDWSYEALDPAAQVLFRRLSVFVGGFTIAAARIAAADDGLDPADVLHLAAELTDASLLVAGDEPGRRIRMLDTVRSYAGELLERTGEGEAVRDRHLEYLADAAARHAPHICFTEAADAFFAAEGPNLLAALGHAVARRPPAAVGLGAALARWYVRNGEYTTGLAAARRAAAADASPTPARAELLAGVASLAVQAGQIAEALESGAQARAIAEDLGLPGTQARALSATVVFLPAAEQLALSERAEVLAREAGETDTLLDVLLSRGATLLGMGEHAGARASLEAALSLVPGAQLPAPWSGWHGQVAGLLAWEAGEEADALAALRLVANGDHPLLACLAAAAVAAVLARLGRTREAAAAAAAAQARAARDDALLVVPVVEAMVAITELGTGDLDAARARSARAASLPTLSPYGAGVALSVAARAAAAAGDPVAAREHAVRLRDSEIARAGNQLFQAGAALALGHAALQAGEPVRAREHFHEAVACSAGRTPMREDALESLGELELGEGRALEGARILGSVAASRAAAGRVALPPCRGRGRAGPAHAWEEGTCLGLDGMAALVQRGRGRRRRGRTGWTSLTPTEQAVASLAARGLSNAEIGGRLFMSLGTVKTHLSSVYAKVGVANRTELAAAGDHGEHRPVG